MNSPNVGGIPFRFFKWSPNYSVEDESSIVSVWISLENLPIFLFHKEALFEIGKLLGTPVKIDVYTANKSKLSQANLCIEMDISKALPNHLWIGILEKGVAVKVNYGSIPHYCNHCNKLGHLEAKCLAKEKTVQVVHRTKPAPKPQQNNAKSSSPAHNKKKDDYQWEEVRKNKGKKSFATFRVGRTSFGGGGRGGRGRGSYHAYYQKNVGSSIHQLADNDVGTSGVKGFDCTNNSFASLESDCSEEDDQGKGLASGCFDEVLIEETIVQESLSPIKEVTPDEDEPGSETLRGDTGNLTQHTEFEPIKLNLVRRKSTEDLCQVPLVSEVYKEKKDAAFRANRILRGVASASSEDDNTEEEVVSSEDEIYARLISSSSLASDKRATRSIVNKLASKVQGSGVKKKGGKADPNNHS